MKGTTGIDRKLLPMKAHFFFSNAGMAPVVPFLPTIARQLGFSSVVVGIVYTILPFISLLMKPLSGIVSDKFQLHKTMFLTVQAIVIVSLLGINFIEPIELGAPMVLQTVVRNANNASAGPYTELRFRPENEDMPTKTIPYRPPDNTSSSSNSSVSSTTTSATTNIACTLNCRTNDTAHLRRFCMNAAVGTVADSARSECEFRLHITANVADIYSHRGDNAEDCLHLPLREQYNDINGVGHSACQVYCNDSDLMSRMRLASGDDRNGAGVAVGDAQVMRMPQFWVFFVCMAFSWTAMTVVSNLADTICFQLLGDRPHLYGKQRLWAAVGWGIFSLIAGYLVDRVSQGETLKDYRVVFVLMAVMLAFDLVFSFRLENIRTTRSASMLTDIGTLLRSPQICVFLLVCVAVGIGTAMLWNFLFWHLEELADASAAAGHGTATRDWMKTLQGLTMGVQCFGGELPFFFYSGALLKRIGHTHAMSLVLVTMSVRFLLYAWLVNPWWVLPIELCQGITYGVFYASMTSYASEIAPKGAGSTMQGLVGAVYEGVGIAAGSLIGGILMGRLGGSQTFGWFGAAGLVLSGAHVLVQMWLARMASEAKMTGKEAIGGLADGADAEMITAKLRET